MKHQVQTYRDAGLEARWIKREGRPVIVIRNPLATLAHQRETWWTVTRGMFEDMQRIGIVEAFTNHTLIGDVFSVPA